MNFVKHVIRTIWADTCEDMAKDQAEFWEPNPLDGWVVLEADGKRLGVYRLHQFNGTTYQICANILPEYRKKYTFEITKVFHDFLLDHVQERVNKFIAFIPECFPNVISYANKSGWETEGKIKEAFQRDGQFYDSVHVGITRKELQQWVQQ
jgi:RimJ/RimL family protein N-acetyltransferase